MQLNNKKIILFLVILVFALALYAYFFYGYLLNYKYSKAEQGILFLSNEAGIDPLLQEIAAKEKFYISPKFSAELGAQNQEMTNALVLLSVVLNGNGKETVTLIRVVDSTSVNNNIAHCETNYGDVKTQAVISKKECEVLLKEENAVNIFVEFPDETLQTSQVIIQGKEIKIIPNATDGADKAAFLAIEKLFPNARQIVDQTNLLANIALG